jgi:hypothetical protein
MTKAEKVAMLQEKASNMLKWFEGRQLPAGRLKISAWATITDANKYFQTQELRMRAHFPNPFCPVFVNAYLALQNLKNFINETEQINNHSQPGTTTAGIGN